MIARLISKLSCNSWENLTIINICWYDLHGGFQNLNSFFLIFYIFLLLYITYLLCLIIFLVYLISKQPIFIKLDYD